MSNLEENKNFKGTLIEFIKLIKLSMYDYFGVSDDKITERLVRYYVTEAIIPRPVREGKDVFYVYDHILKFLYARKQIIDGWPMSKLKENMEFQDNEYFENFINDFSQLDSNEDAMSLIREFKSEAKYSPEMNFSSRTSPLSYSKRVDIPNLKDALISINADLGNVVKQEFTTLQMASWLVLLIENHKLSGMTYELSRKIGDAVSAALIERNPMTSQELQQEFYQYKDFESLKRKIENLSQENEHLRYMLHEEKEANVKSNDLKFQAISNLTENINDQKSRVFENNSRTLVSYYEMKSNIEAYINTLKEIEDDELRKEIADLLRQFDLTMDKFEINFNQIAEENETVLNKLQAELERTVLTLKK